MSFVSVILTKKCVGKRSRDLEKKYTTAPFYIIFTQFSNNFLIEKTLFCFKLFAKVTCPPAPALLKVQNFAKASTIITFYFVLNFILQ